MKCLAEVKRFQTQILFFSNEDKIGKIKNNRLNKLKYIILFLLKVIQDLLEVVKKSAKRAQNEIEDLEKIYKF